MRRRVTSSRNLTVSLSRTCVSHRKYCAFATHQPHLHAPDAVDTNLGVLSREDLARLREATASQGLMEESISRLAGSYHGVRLDPPQLIAAAHDAGRPAAQRTTLYDLVPQEQPA